MKNTTFSTLFYCRSGRINKEGRTLIRCRITVNGIRAEFSTQLSVKTDSWDTKRGKIKGSNEEAKKMNFQMDKIRNRIHEIYQETLLNGKSVSADFLRVRYLNKEDDRLTFLRCFEKYNNQKLAKVGTEFVMGSVRNYFVTFRFIQEFIKQKYYKNDIPLNELNKEFLIDYEIFLKQVKGTGQNGSMKHLQRIKSVIYYAMDNEWLEKNPFQGHHCKFKKFNRDFLNEVELEILENTPLPTEKLRIVRDVFLFACYTGYSYADVSRLKPGNIQLGSDKEQWIITRRKKTDISSNVPLLPKAADLVKQYSVHPVCIQRGTLFPVYSNQKLNEFLKELAAYLKIDKNISFHMARHTFATTVTLTNGVPIETISKLLGHTNLKTTQIYSRIIEEKVSFDMRVLKQKLEDKKIKNQSESYDRTR